MGEMTGPSTSDPGERAGEFFKRGFLRKGIPQENFDQGFQPPAEVRRM
ncbi:MAG: hypothetical protein KJ727_01170 [Acidobacteria bacterium]|nr:hypothetical protein [Acidobacteriota bacterium]MBU4253197.1 hypothetical protein [Acidobacteriota bacterium]MBU4330680.1 hypothetical protein [Acidobacteriota bacterium]MBU4495981.1 hypothetical protein [Acidobacteriota bacterium]MCG2816717.1 hypothetical protein [Candidatus Aminicenantes bacterium]